MVLRQFVTNPTKELAMNFPLTLSSVVGILWHMLIALVVILFSLAMIYRAMDSWFLPRYRLNGRVDFRRHYPGILDPAHELYSPENKIRPDRWYVFVSANAESWSIPIDAKGFDSVSPGDPVMIELSYGRFTGKRYGVRLIGRS